MKDLSNKFGIYCRYCLRKCEGRSVPTRNRFRMRHRAECWKVFGERI